MRTLTRQGAALLLAVLFLVTSMLPAYSGFNGPRSLPGGGTVNQIPVLDSSNNLSWRNPTVFNVLTYGAVPNDGADDYTAINNAFTAVAAFTNAGNGPAELVFPAGTYDMSASVTMPTALGAPQINATDTSAETVSFDRSHTKLTGDTLSFQGFTPAGVSANTVYYVCRVSSTSVKLYDTRAHAVSCGSTGRVDVTGGITSTATTTSGSATFTVGSATGLATNQTVAITGATCANGLGLPVITGISGTDITVNCTLSATVSGATITYQGVIDPNFMNTGITLRGDGNAVIRKMTGFSGNPLFYFWTGNKLRITGLQFSGLATDTLTTISAGDDGIRVFSGWNTTIDHCNFRNFGDSALKLSTYTFDTIGGVHSSDFDVHDNYFYNVQQTSTTSNDTGHGGAANINFHDNRGNHICAFKFAGRTAGSNNLMIHHNIITNAYGTSGSAPILVQGYSDVDIDGNLIYSAITGTLVPGITWTIDTAAGLTAYAAASVKIHDNTIDTSGYGILVNNASYNDGTTLPLRDAQVYNNSLRNLTGTGSSPGIGFTGNDYEGIRIAGNEIDGIAAPNVIQVSLKGNASYYQDIAIEGNRVRGATSTTAIGFNVARGSGTDLINGVTIRGNRYENSAGQYCWGVDHAQNVVVDGNYCNITGAGTAAINTGTTNTNEAIRNNWFVSTGSGLNLDTITNAEVTNNHLEAPTAAYALRFAATVTGARESGNVIIGGRTYSISTFSDLSNNGRKILRLTGGSGTPSFYQTWEIGDRLEYQTPTSGGSLGQIATAAGTTGTLAGVTADTTNGSTVITVNTTTGLRVGDYVSVAGGSTLTARRITAISGTSVTLSGSNEASAVTGQAVSYSAPTFKAYGTIAELFDLLRDNVVALRSDRLKAA